MGEGGREGVWRGLECRRRFPQSTASLVSGIVHQRSRIVLLTSTSLGCCSGEAGTGSEMQGFCFVSHPSSQMSGCQDFLQHSLEASDKLGFAWELGGGGQSTFFFKLFCCLS